MTADTRNPEAASASVDWDGGELVITRTFAAPRGLVFQAWTRPEHFARWFGPAGSTVSISRMDVRPGGTVHYCHHLPEYEDVWVKGVYGEVAAPERLSFTCFFSDPEGNRVERPGFPREMTITVTLAEVAEGTRLTMRQAGLVTDQGEVQGWTESLDRLAELLAGA